MPVRKKLWSSNLEDGVDIAITHGKYQVEAEFPVTVGQQFQSVSIKYPDRIALKYKQGATWSQVSYSKYFINCIKVAKTFMKVIYTSPLLHISHTPSSSLLYFLPLAGSSKISRCCYHGIQFTRVVLFQFWSNICRVRFHNLFNFFFLIKYF